MADDSRLRRLSIRWLSRANHPQNSRQPEVKRAYEQCSDELYREIDGTGDPALSWQTEQARRYMEAIYGDDVWFRAPETFTNLVERWIWAVASGHQEAAADTMTTIEQLARTTQPPKG